MVRVRENYKVILIMNRRRTIRFYVREKSTYVVVVRENYKVILVMNRRRAIRFYVREKSTYVVRVYEDRLCIE